MVETSIAASPTDEEPAESAFFTENMAAFREHAPLLHTRLAQVRATHSRLFFGDDGALDIALGDRRFYGEDAVAFTQSQVDKFRAKPERRFIDSLSFGKLGGIEGRYQETLEDMLQAEAVNLAEQRIDEASHFTLVFGLGLGLHLEPLMEFTQCAHLIVVEPNFDNLYHSLSVVDWRNLFEQAEENGCAIHLVLDNDQAHVASHLRTLIRMGGPALVDGIYIYQHYASSFQAEAHHAFQRDFAMHVLGLGFFEDELLMMANAVANLKLPDIRILASPSLVRSEPVIICGSGPSIDNDLEVIAAQRDRAIVVSMGSSIRTLLKHGIRPDIHVETENHPANAANIVRVADEYGLTGITLLGASTVMSAMSERFDDVIAYFRDRQTPAEIFGRGIDHMGSSGPVVANAALVTLAHLGFRDLYLFGVDMGSRQAGNYHSADTYIGTGAAVEWAEDTRWPVAANFGGEAVAETILDWSRLGFESVLKLHPSIRCVNCSDGARIAGAVPMLPRILDLPNPPLDHDHVMREIRGNLPVFPLELSTRIWDETDLDTISQDVFARFDTLLAAAAESDDPGLAWAYELYDLFQEVNAISSAMGVFLFGTTCLYQGIFWWFDGRIEDAEIRRRFRRFAAQEMRKLFADMERRLSTLTTDIGRCLAGEISAVDYQYLSNYDA